MLRYFAVAALIALAAVQAPAQEVKRSSGHGAWGVFRDGTGADLLCWVAASARLGALPLDGEAVPPEQILVLFTPSNGQLSMELRGGATPREDGIFTVGDDSFAIFFQDGWGWLKSKGADTLVKGLMRTHETAYVRIGEAGYALSLEGFAPAVEEAKALCR